MQITRGLVQTCIGSIGAVVSLICFIKSLYGLRDPGYYEVTLDGVKKNSRQQIENTISETILIQDNENMIPDTTIMQDHDYEVPETDILV